MAKRTGEIYIELQNADMNILADVETAVREHTHRRDSKSRKLPVDVHQVWDYGELQADGDALLSVPDYLFFPPALISEIRQHLHRFRFDQYRVRQLFCWDNPTWHNAALPDASMTILMGNGKRFPNIYQFENPALDISLMTDPGREYSALTHPEIKKLLERHHPPKLEKVKCGS